jgi:hypothetical protein
MPARVGVKFRLGVGNDRRRCANANQERLPDHGGRVAVAGGISGRGRDAVDEGIWNFGNSNSIRKDFWRDTAAARRAVLMPFLWGTVAREGQLWGNRARRSEVRVANGRNFSHPGYNEFLTGYVDPKIDSNDKNLNATQMSSSGCIPSRPSVGASPPR